MRPLIAAAACCALACLAAPGAHADFVLRQTPPPSMPADVPAEVPRIPVPRPSLPRAAGFGEDVPLRFAVAQIVPKDVRVEWSPDVHQEAEVSWRGDRPWNVALAEALRPHGYKLRVAGWRAHITK